MCVSFFFFRACQAPVFFFFRVCQTPDSSNSLFRVIILTTPWLRAAIPYAASSALLTSTSMLVLAPCVLPFQATPQCFPQVLIRICPVLGTLLLPCSVGLRPPLSRPPFVRNRSIVPYPVRRVIRAPDLSLLPLSSIPLPPVLLGCR
jgi:hypothetical protein